MSNQSAPTINDRIKENISLKEFTTFRIGGAARYFFVANDSDELQQALDYAAKNKLNYFILGGGSNILVSDAGFNGLVIKLSNNYFKFRDNIMECGAGLPLSKALGESLSAGLTGLEWAAGIPGTIGGAIHGNAGAYGGEMGLNIKEVIVLRNGKIKKLRNKDCLFVYRDSLFKNENNHDIILSAVMQLKKASQAELDAAKEKIMKIIKERAQKFKGFSAGSAFKNIVLSEREIKEFKAEHPRLPEQFVEYRKIPAAWLIEECELKGRTIGGAKVSENHAGIITSDGAASAENVIMLISIIKQKVRQKFNLELMEEIEYIGF